MTALAQDVEYRTREIIQEAAKFMINAKRTKLTVEDVNYALQSRNVEASYHLIITLTMRRVEVIWI